KFKLFYQMPHRSSLEVSARIDHWWSIAKHDILEAPWARMTTAGLFQIGLPGAGAAVDSYGAIAFAEQAMAARTGRVGLASGGALRSRARRLPCARTRAGGRHAGRLSGDGAAVSRCRGHRRHCQCVGPAELAPGKMRRPDRAQ